MCKPVDVQFRVTFDTSMINTSCANCPILIWQFINTEWSLSDDSLSMFIRYSHLSAWWKHARFHMHRYEYPELYLRNWLTKSYGLLLSKYIANKMHYSALQQSDDDPMQHSDGMCHFLRLCLWPSLKSFTCIGTALESKQIPFFMRALLLIVGFCIAVDVCLAMYAGALYLQSSQWLSLEPLPSPIATLERSTYIRFDELYANRSRSIVYDPIINLPRVSVQTSSRQQEKSIHYPDETLITDNGLVPVYSMKLQVSSEVNLIIHELLWISHCRYQISTIIQFRTIDYGMENCSLVLTVPMTLTGNSSFEAPDFDKQKASQIHIWAVSQLSKLDSQNITWNTKPPLRTFLGQLDARMGFTATISNFPCKSGAYFTFELSCATVDCGIDATMKNKDAVGMFITHYTAYQHSYENIWISGLYLLQHQTI